METTQQKVEQVTALIQSGVKVKDACKQVGIADATYYTQRPGYVPWKNRLKKRLQEENGSSVTPVKPKRKYTRRKKLVAKESRNQIQIASLGEEKPMAIHIKFCPECGHYLAPYMIAAKHSK